MRRALALSVALVALAAICTNAEAKSRDRYCLIQAGSQAKNCGFVTMAQCQKSKGAPVDTCERNTGVAGHGRRK